MQDKLFLYNFKILYKFNSVLNLIPAYLDHVGFVTHAADLGHIPHLLLDQRSLKCHQHE